MELLLCLVLLGIARVAIATQAATLGTAAVYGALLVAALEAGALWTLRAKLPSRAANSLHFPRLSTTLLWTGFCVAAVGVVIAVDLLFPVEETVEGLFRPFANHWAGWMALVLVVPLVEEIVFRAAVLELLLPRLRPTYSLLCSALLFSVVHGDARQAGAAFFVGLAFGLAYIKTRSVMPGVIAHAAANAMGLALVLRASG